ncbi:MAG: VWA domain-containing protein [Bradymonadaceae bacterium]
MADSCDNCPSIPNTPQFDTDGDGLGDVCEVQPPGDVCEVQTKNFDRLKPNIYTVIDRSTSMDTRGNNNETRMKRARDGLDAIASSLAGDIRIGMSTFPCARGEYKKGQDDGSDGMVIQACGDFNAEFLPIGDYNTNQIQASYTTSYTPANQSSDNNDSRCPHATNATSWKGLTYERGGKHLTPTGMALWDVRTSAAYSDNNDPNNSLRNKGVILITDGAPCSCGDGECPEDVTTAHTVYKQAEKLKQAGVPVYVVGFGNVSGNANFQQNLNTIAEAGGTDRGSPGPPRYWEAGSAGGLASAFEEIVASTASCTIEPDPAPPAANRLWVKVADSWVPRGASDGFTYDESSNQLTLHGSACDALKEADPDASPLEIHMGCPADCTSGQLEPASAAVYQIDATNAGDRACGAPVHVRDRLPDCLEFKGVATEGWTCEIDGHTLSCTYPGGLDSGESPPTIDVRVRVTDACTGPVKNCALVSADGDVDVTNNEACVSSSVGDGGGGEPAESKLSLEKTGPDSAIEPGSTTTWSVTVSNDGPDDHTGTLNVSDDFPDCMQFGGASPSDWMCSPNSGTVDCVHPGPLAAGDSLQLDLSFRVPADCSQKLENCATLEADGDASDGDDEDCAATELGGTSGKAADLSLEKTSGQRYFEKSGTFTMTVSNNGPNAEPGGFEVVDPLPRCLTMTSFDPMNNWSCSTSTSNMQETVTCTYGSSLSPGDSVSLKLKAERMGDGACKDKSTTNKAVVNGSNDPNSTNDEDETSEIIFP